ncbi:MAG: alpha/beta fold hydrolase, partial [Acidobacteriota bacterium]|nr:alpha/beta fold hydrolase [Acidobacteriota bacterium]
MPEPGEPRDALAIAEHTTELQEIPVFWRTAPHAGEHPPLYLHGVPTCADDWGRPPLRRPTSPGARRRKLSARPHGRREERRGRAEREALRGDPGFLGRCGGIAVDLPGFGRSGKPGNRRYDIAEYDRFIESFLDHLGVARVELVVHDWGAVGLAFAQRLPERVERLVVMNAVPFLPGYRWHRIARLWRTPVVGELVMGSTTPAVLRLLSRESN